MTRLLYAVGGGDVLSVVSADPTGSDASHRDFGPLTGSVTIWSADRSTQITDLVTADPTSFAAGTAVTSITADTATGRICFYGPDGTDSDLWVKDANSRFWQVKPVISRFGAVGKLVAAAADAATARAAIAALGGAGTTDSSTVGRQILAAANVSAVLTLLGLDTASLNAIIQNFLTANGYVHTFVVGPADSFPTTALPGDILAQLATSPTAGFTFTDLGEIAATGTGTTVSQTPSANGGTDVVYAHCTSGCAAATVTAGGAAAVPTGITGGGRTWTKVANTDVVSANSQVASSVWKGVPTSGSGTTAAVVATFPTGMDARVIRLVQVTGGAGTVAQAANSGSTASTAPTVALSTVNAAHGMLAFCTMNSASQTIAAATGSAFSELTPQLTSTAAAAALRIAAWDLSTGQNSITLAGSGSSQKLLTLLELS